MEQQNLCHSEDTDEFNKWSHFSCLCPSIHTSSDDWAKKINQKLSNGNNSVSSEGHTGLRGPESRALAAQGAVIFDPEAFREV